MEKFTGFLPETIDFLWEIRMNNSKEWMDQNRERYKSVLKIPFDQFSAAIAEGFGETTGEKMDWSVSRINRDIRYSKDKSPYRSCRWVVLKEPLVVGTEWKLHPAFYFELSPEGYSHGMGVYEATPAYLNAYREKIRNAPEDFAKIISKVEKKKEFILMGEDYKKVDASGLPEGVSRWYIKKNFYISETKNMEDIIFSSELAQMLVEKWKSLVPLYHFLKEIKCE